MMIWLTRMPMIRIMMTMLIMTFLRLLKQLETWLRMICWSKSFPPDRARGCTWWALGVQIIIIMAAMMMSTTMDLGFRLSSLWLQGTRRAWCWLLQVHGCPTSLCPHRLRVQGQAGGVGRAQCQVLEHLSKIWFPLALVLLSKVFWGATILKYFMGKSKQVDTHIIHRYHMKDAPRMTSRRTFNSSVADSPTFPE